MAGNRDTDNDASLLEEKGDGSVGNIRVYNRPNRDRMRLTISLIVGILMMLISIAIFYYFGFVF